MIGNRGRDSNRPLKLRRLNKVLSEPRLRASTVYGVRLVSFSFACLSRLSLRRTYSSDEIYAKVDWENSCTGLLPSFFERNRDFVWLRLRFDEISPLGVLQCSEPTEAMNCFKFGRPCVRLREGELSTGPRKSPVLLASKMAYLSKTRPLP